MSKKKILSIAIITILFLVCVLNSNVFATNIVTIDASNTSGSGSGGTGASSITITPQSNNTANTANTANNQAEQASNNSSVNNLTASNNSARNNNVSSYNNSASTANRTGLPYTGSGSSVAFIIIAVIASAVYAYKKVRDYNI